MSPSLKLDICNGCGPWGARGFWAALVPDHFLGIPITEPCNIHDYYYGILHQKFIGDFVFLLNMIIAITRYEKYSVLNRTAGFLPRLVTVIIYFIAVLIGGRLK